LLALNGSDNLGQLTDLHDCLIEVVLIFLLDLELELSESVVDLVVQIDAVTEVLEVVIGVD
jgi:hypothetical protein